MGRYITIIILLLLFYYYYFTLHYKKINKKYCKILLTYLLIYVILYITREEKGKNEKRNIYIHDRCVIVWGVSSVRRL